MNLISRSIVGLSMIFIGLVLMAVSLFEFYFLLIYGVPIFILGFVILFNKKEDYIEPIKSLKGGRKK